jgi:hypothetical protein
VLVAHRANGFHPGPAARRGSLLVSDLVSRRHAGPRRVFWLLGEDVQLVWEPFGWRKEWYIDIVAVEESRTGRDQRLYTVTDRYIDVVVQDMGPTYRMLDLDEAGEALLSGDLTPRQLATAMKAAQRFIDRYLHRGRTFPPPQMSPWFAADHRYPRLP